MDFLLSTVYPLLNFTIQFLHVTNVFACDKFKEERQTLYDEWHVSKGFFQRT